MYVQKSRFEKYYEQGSIQYSAVVTKAKERHALLEVLISPPPPPVDTQQWCSVHTFFLSQMNMMTVLWFQSSV
jgi:hypothetical protein